MDNTLHDLKDSKLWELWYIPYILSINSINQTPQVFFGNGVCRQLLHGPPCGCGLVPTGSLLLGSLGMPFYRETFLGSPVVPFYPFSFWVPLLKPNSKKKGTLIVKGLLGNLVLEVFKKPPLKRPKKCSLKGPFGVLGPSTVEARKLEHQYPHALKVKFRGS